MSRIIGQCNQVDFTSIEHLAAITEDPELLDVSTLNRKERLAFIFLSNALRKGISWELLRSVVQEVLFWGEDEDNVEHMEIRLKRDPLKSNEIRKFKLLWP